MKIEKHYDRYYKLTNNPLAAALLVIARMIERNERTLEDEDDPEEDDPNEDEG
jgi:hypothetical protein